MKPIMQVCGFWPAKGREKMKKNTLFGYLGIIPVLTVVGLLMVGCPNQEPVKGEAGGGVKDGSTYTFTFRNSSSYEVTVWIEGAVSGNITTDEVEKKLAKGESYTHKHALSKVGFEYYPADKVVYSDSGKGEAVFKDK